MGAASSDGYKHEAEERDLSATGRRNYWDSLGETQTIASLVFLYCALHFLLRFMLSPNLNGAEAEQALFSQSLQWGYRPGHPPLAAWLSWSVLAASQNSRLALFLSREAVLGIGLVAYFAAARRIVEDAHRAALATLFLLAAYGVGWLLHLGSFESSLLATMCAIYLWADSRALMRGTFVDYGLLGAATGLGVLSSYVFVVLPFAMSVALAFVPELRARLRIQPLLLAASVALAIVAPYFAFAPDALAMAASGSRLPALGDLALALIAFALPAALLFFLLYPRVLRRIAHAETQPLWLRFLSIAMVVAVIVSAAAVLLLHGDPFAFAYPVLLPLPIWLFLQSKRVYGEDTRTRDKRFALGVLACVVIGIGLRVWMYETRAHDCRHCAEYWPMPRYADAFRRAGFVEGTIAAPDSALAGNLRMHFPDDRVVTPLAPASRFGPAVSGECLIVWEGDGSVPKALHDYVTQTYGAKLEVRAMQGDVESALLTSKGRLTRMNFLILAQGACDRPRP